MKFLLPGYEILPIPDFSDADGVLKLIEKIGRTCYKSEARITPDSAAKFVENIKNRKHWALLEHYNFTMEVTPSMYKDLMKLHEILINDDPEVTEKARFLHLTVHQEGDRKVYLVSTSATTLNYLYQCVSVQEDLADCTNIIRVLFAKLSFVNPILTYIPLDQPAKMIDLNDVDCVHILSRDEIRSLPANVRMHHDFMSVKFTVDRGVTHEIVRHRPVSYAQESTRYVNYGKGGCKFIIPLWIPDEDKETLLDDNKVEEMLTLQKEDANANPYNLDGNTEMWFHVMKCIEETYMSMINSGWTPQQARFILPNCTKAEITMTANLYEFRHFFKMRVPAAAHPQIREVAGPLLKDAIIYDPDVFGDLTYLYGVKEA